MADEPLDEPLQYTHSGRRYLLGYGVDYFGIWDRRDLARTVSRYPRSDEGWRAAWRAFSAEEPDSVEVGIAWSKPVPHVSVRHPTHGVSAAWWLLPIFMGWLGGLIAWLVNKELDPRIARAMLATGIIVSAVVFVVAVTVMAPSVE